MNSNNEEILNTLLESGVKEAWQLDDLVHDVASNMASNINNGGLAEQVKFLTKNGLDLNDIRTAAVK